MISKLTLTLAVILAVGNASFIPVHELKANVKSAVTSAVESASETIDGFVDFFGDDEDDTVLIVDEPVGEQKFVFIDDGNSLPVSVANVKIGSRFRTLDAGQEFQLLQSTVDGEDVSEFLLPAGSEDVVTFPSSVDPTFVADFAREGREFDSVLAREANAFDVDEVEGDVITEEAVEDNPKKNLLANINEAFNLPAFPSKNVFETAIEEEEEQMNEDAVEVEVPEELSTETVSEDAEIEAIEATPNETKDFGEQLVDGMQTEIETVDENSEAGSEVDIDTVSAPADHLVEDSEEDVVESMEDVEEDFSFEDNEENPKIADSEEESEGLVEQIEVTDDEAPGQLEDIEEEVPVDAMGETAPAVEDQGVVVDSEAVATDEVAEEFPDETVDEDLSVEEIEAMIESDESEEPEVGVSEEGEEPEAGEPAIDRSDKGPETMEPESQGILGFLFSKIL